MSRVSKEYYELKKKAIVDATLEVCEKKTISSITMQDIINATGLSQGAIYRYYKNIDEILADLLSRIHIEQYESVDRLNEFIDMETKQIVDLHSLPITPEMIERRRRLIAKQIESLYNAWAEELQNFLYPHKRIELEFLILADNFPERARAIFPNVVPAKDIDNRIVDALTKEIEDGVITPKISLEEFMEYNASVFEGIVGRAISENCLKRNRDFDESNSYDIKKRFETFARSSLMFLGIDEFLD